MISQVTGILIEKELPLVVIETYGLGYEISVPMTTGFELPGLGEKLTLFTHFIVREDAQLLYGFYTRSTREVFRELIKINGVGPKIALAILSGMDEINLKKCIDQKDIGALSNIPGIGKKTAERLVIELQDKLKNISYLHSANSGLAGSSGASGSENLSQSKNQEDAFNALISLGYKNAEAKRFVDQALKRAEGVLSSEEIIRLALKSQLSDKN
jgi:Holliday junction DNA helicase RuvA